MDWEPGATIPLSVGTVELSKPVLVKRSRWYCWFPSLIRQPNGILWAVMSAHADIHLSNTITTVKARNGTRSTS